MFKKFLFIWINNIYKMEVDLLEKLYLFLKICKSICMYVYILCDLYGYYIKDIELL